MNKKSWFLIAVAIVLGLVYVIYFSGWFKPKVMALAHTGRFGQVSFTLEAPHPLTSIKVVSVTALESNKYALPVWELKSAKGSVPTKLFSYGEQISGMEPNFSSARPEPLLPGTTYRLIVEAGSLRAEHDFTTDAGRGAGRPRP